jgi:hypothetical protein
MNLNLTENAKRYIKWGAIAVGVGVAGFVVYKATKKPKAALATSQKAALSGVGKRKKRKTKKTKKTSAKRTIKHLN